jgi:hypothetical protein
MRSFDANNDGSTGPAGPTPGTAWYEVLGTLRGCVTAYSVQDASPPRVGARERLALLGRPYLPRDARRISTSADCDVWRSAELQRATGLPYARAVASARVSGGLWRAEVEASYLPAC